MDDWMNRMAEVLPPGMTLESAAQILRGKYRLTPRVSVIGVHLLIDGSDADIGRRLGCSGNTTKKHRREILRALAVETCRGAAVKIARTIAEHALSNPA